MSIKSFFHTTTRLPKSVCSDKSLATPVFGPSGKFIRYVSARDPVKARSELFIENQFFLS